MLPFHLGEQTSFIADIKGIKSFHDFFPCCFPPTFLSLLNIQKLILGVEQKDGVESRFMIIYVASSFPFEHPQHS